MLLSARRECCRKRAVDGGEEKVIYQPSASANGFREKPPENKETLRVTS